VRSTNCIALVVVSKFDHNGMHSAAVARATISASHLAAPALRSP
jgi:hypothetical protein